MIELIVSALAGLAVVTILLLLQELKQERLKKELYRDICNVYLQGLNGYAKEANQFLKAMTRVAESGKTDAIFDELSILLEEQKLSDKTWLSNTIEAMQVHEELDKIVS